MYTFFQICKFFFSIRPELCILKQIPALGIGKAAVLCNNAELVPPLQSPTDVALEMRGYAGLWRELPNKKVTKKCEFLITQPRQCSKGAFVHSKKLTRIVQASIMNGQGIPTRYAATFIISVLLSL